MSGYALRIQAVSKTFRLPGGRSFQALDALSLDLQWGEVLGLIGSNGAGKSTLLKILSRITPPSQGRVEIYGALASLLEVGTGFHPELSGRDNIFLNGALLGMSKNEIRRQFDAIVAFAGTEAFLNVPVKRYSSGMFVRLAFAVAAHLRADILLIDEVLAVGDAAFQKKCLAKMDDLCQDEGRSIIFVSHNLSAVQSLCPQAAVLDQGRLRFRGNCSAAIRHYLDQQAAAAPVASLAERKDREGTGPWRWQAAQVLGSGGESFWRRGETGRLTLSLRGTAPGQPRAWRSEAVLFNHRGNYLSTFSHQGELGAQQEELALELSLENLPLMGGLFFFNLHFYVQGERQDFVGRAVYVEVIDDRNEAPKMAAQKKNPGVYLNSRWRSS